MRTTRKSNTRKTSKKTSMKTSRKTSKKTSMKNNRKYTKKMNMKGGTKGNGKSFNPNNIMRKADESAAAAADAVAANKTIKVNGSNGSNACWLNSSMYAFVSNPVIFKIRESIQKEFELNHTERILTPEQTIEYNEMYKLLKKAKNKKDTWGDELYLEIYKHLEKYKIYDLTQWGHYGNPQPIMDYFLNIITFNNYKRNHYLKLGSVITSNNDDLIKLKTNNPGYTIISIVKAQNCKQNRTEAEMYVNNQATGGTQWGHFVSFSLVEGTTWYFTDMVRNGTQPDTTTFENIINLPGKCDDDKVNQYICLFVKTDKYKEALAAPAKNEDETTRLFKEAVEKTAKGQGRIKAEDNRKQLELKSKYNQAVNKASRGDGRIERAVRAKEEADKRKAEEKEQAKVDAQQRKAFWKKQAQEQAQAQAKAAE